MIVNILVFDIGTTSMRGILYDQTGKELLQVSRLTPLIFKDEYIEQNPLFLKEQLFSIAKEIAEKEEVDAITLTAFRSAPALFDEQGKPLSNFIMWQDTRNKEICNDLLQYNSKSYEKTGSKVNAVFAASKITWLKHNLKQAYDKAYKAMVVPAYLIYLMTGIWSCDVTYGSRTGLMNIKTLEYDPEMLKMYNLDEEKLAELSQVGSIAGKTTDYFSQETGIRSGIPVISTGGDQQNSALGLGEVDSSALVINCGTGGYIIALNDKPYLENEAIVCNVSAIPNKFVLEEGVLASASGLNWLIKELFPELWNEGDPDFEAFHKIIETSPLGSNGVICVPLFQGCGSRDWNPEAKASFSGITLRNTRADIGRSLFEGIAAEITKSVASLPGGLEKEVIYIGGGLTKSSFFDQILCDMLNTTLLCYKDSQATAIGSFISAAVALGVYDTYEDAFRSARANDQVTKYEPNPEAHAEYLKLIERSEEVYKKLN